MQMFRKKDGKNPTKKNMEAFKYNEVLDYVVKLAPYYSQNKDVDPRAMPVVLPLGRLISVVDAYIHGGVAGIANNDYQKLMESSEKIRERLTAVGAVVESMEDAGLDYKEVDE